MLNMYYPAFTVFVILPLSLRAFNLSPYPSLVINSPKDLNSQLKQTRSSYFGYTLVIRPSSIIVGAPRDQLTLKLQKSINEPGAIYRCSLEKDDCSPYILHSRASADRNNSYNGGRDFQWLGGSMDGGTLDTDMLIACAPRFYRLAENKNEYLMSGECYAMQNTVDIHAERVKSIIADCDNSEVNKCLMLAMGSSAHVVEDNTNFLIGAPGRNLGNGSFFNYRLDTNLYILSGEFQTDPPLGSDPFYLGYAVSSGHFDSDDIESMLYVVTAPRTNQPSGEAYIYSKDGKILHKLEGEQLGEYFGYSVLAEDLNGDKLTDLIVSAPMHGTKDTADSGAIYVFINQGQMNFEKKIVRSPLASSGRFGTTLSRLGDINHDGFNDVAVGAPFAGNGSVFIYLGSEHGLQDVPSQQLDSPAEHPSKYGVHMFGHGLSRGADIDENGFNDFAVGAPNAEAVFLYRAYPVVKIYGTVRSDERQIKPQQKTLNITACYRLSTTAKKREVHNQLLTIRIVADPQLKRTTFALTQTSEVIFQLDVGQNEQCRVLELQVSFTQMDVYKPIDVQMHYEVLQNNSAQEYKDKRVFCETCVVVDPTEPKTSLERIVFNVGCASAVCIADMQLNSVDEGSTFTLGSNGILRLIYEITNAGETAYLPQFNVTSDPQLRFAQVPGNCQVSDAVMMCNINGGQALGKGETDYVTVSFDVSQLTGKLLVVTAEVFSTGHEKKPEDNKQVNEISLLEFTDIDVMGEQISPQAKLDNYEKSVEVLNHFEIKSHGPSAIDQLAVILQIPIAYKAVGSSEILPIINTTSLKVLATHNFQPLAIKLFDQDNNQLSEKTENDLTDQTKKKLDGTNSETLMIRNRRDLEIPVNTSYDLLSGNFKGKLPLNRTVVFSCQDSERTMCIRVSVKGVRFRLGDSVYLNVSYHVNLGAVNAILVNPWDYFVILTDVELAKKDDPSSSSLTIKRRIEPNILFKHLKAYISISHILPAAFVGLLIFAVVKYTMYKFGFFRRPKREQMHTAIKQRSQVQESDLNEENSP